MSSVCDLIILFGLKWRRRSDGIDKIACSQGRMQDLLLSLG